MCSSMTTSILDEKEMSTSFLSQAAFPDNDSLVESFPSSMVNSADFNLLSSSIHGSNSLRRDLMESSLVNSGTFNSMMDSFEDKLPNGKSKFQLKRSFLKETAEDRISIDKYLKLNANCNTDDLKNLAIDLLAAAEKKEDFNSTFNMANDKGDDDDSFLLTEGMTDSFLKYSTRESLNVTYNKLPDYHKISNMEKESRNEMNETVLLPNQTFVSSNQNQSLANKDQNGFYNTITASPKKNSTFRKKHPDSVPNANIDIGNEFENQENIDSNKRGYISADISNVSNLMNLEINKRLKLKVCLVIYIK